MQTFDERNVFTNHGGLPENQRAPGVNQRWLPLNEIAALINQRRLPFNERTLSLNDRKLSLKNSPFSERKMAPLLTKEAPLRTNRSTSLTRDAPCSIRNGVYWTTERFVLLKGPGLPIECGEIRSVAALISLHPGAFAPGQNKEIENEY